MISDLLSTYQGLGIWCMGTAYNDLLRSILVQLVEPTHRGTLLTTVAMVENSAAVVAGPSFSWIFRIGLALFKHHGDNIWLGLPFITAASLLGPTMLVLYKVRVSMALS